MNQQPARFANESYDSNFIPWSVIKTSREEITDLTLVISKYIKHEQISIWELVPEEKVVELPPGLHGYIFTVGALFQSEDRPQEDGTQLYTGDGMIYRLGFEENKAILKTRITKTPCYYADIAITEASNSTIWMPKTTFAKQHWLWSYFAAFRNGGPSRFSILLGGRNQLNTAFLRVRERLIVTIDAGRPYEVDPDSMELIAPIGSTKQWLGIFPVVSRIVSWLTGSYPFDVYINSAHPVADLKISNVNLSAEATDGFFTTNYSTGYNGIYQRQINWIFDQINGLFRGGASAKEQFGRFTDLLYYQFSREGSEIDPQSKSDDDKFGEPGKPKLQRWRLVIANGSQKDQPVIVEQSLHQLAITEKFIVLADIAFKMEFSQIFSPFLFGFLKLKLFQRYWSLGEWIHAKFLKGVLPVSKGILYIIDRSDLEKSFAYTVEESPKTLLAKQIILPYEISHFAADYSNPDERITLHVGHNNGWDVTEWITRYDLSVPGKPCLRSDLEGMQVGTTDLGALAKYIINGKSGEIEQVQLLQDFQRTWSPSIYTHSELCRDGASNEETKIKNIYWITWGFSWELVPQRIYDAYQSRCYRSIPIENLPDQNKPLTLLRLDTQSMSIVDSFQFPPGYFASSPQFIPSSEPLQDKDASEHGFIVCTVLSDLSDDSSNKKKPSDEFWIFNANDFQKPVYRLSAPSKDKPLNLALTLHTTWMPEIRSDLQRKRYSDINVREKLRSKSIHEDYDSCLENASSTVRKLFDKVIYQYFIKQILEEPAIKKLQQPDYHDLEDD
jgi:hypothetical protein